MDEPTEILDLDEVELKALLSRKLEFTVLTKNQIALIKKTRPDIEYVYQLFPLNTDSFKQHKKFNSDLYFAIQEILVTLGFDFFENLQKDKLVELSDLIRDITKS